MQIGANTGCVSVKSLLTNKLIAITISKIAGEPYADGARMGAPQAVQVAAGLKTIYTAASAEEVEMNLEIFEQALATP